MVIEGARIDSKSVSRRRRITSRGVAKSREKARYGPGIAKSEKRGEIVYLRLTPRNRSVCEGEPARVCPALTCREHMVHVHAAGKRLLRDAVERHTGAAVERLTQWLDSAKYTCALDLIDALAPTPEHSQLREGREVSTREIGPALGVTHQAIVATEDRALRKMAKRARKLVRE